MKQSNTSCEKCYFAKPADSDLPCAFFIIDAIKDLRKIDTVNSYYYINDYQCKYGVSKNIAENRLSDFNIDITEYAKQQTAINYSIYIKLYNLDIDNIKTVCYQIKQLSIAPKSINIVFDNASSFNTIKDTCTAEFSGLDFTWKLHNFLEQQTDEDQLHTCLCTDKQLSTSQFIWILNDTILNICSLNDSINHINYLCNIEQPKLAIFANNCTDIYFYGMFISLENLKGLWTHEGRNLDSAIKKLYPLDLQRYD